MAGRISPGRCVPAPAQASSQSQSKHATGLNGAEERTLNITMAVKATHLALILMLSLTPAAGESIMDYLRNREDLSQVSSHLSSSQPSQGVRATFLQSSSSQYSISYFKSDWMSLITMQSINFSDINGKCNVFIV